jgi:hypothetical protein
VRRARRTSYRSCRSLLRLFRLVSRLRSSLELPDRGLLLTPGVLLQPLLEDAFAVLQAAHAVARDPKSAVLAEANLRDDFAREWLGELAHRSRWLKEVLAEASILLTIERAE